jgi:hypothetical protein
LPYVLHDASRTSSALTSEYFLPRTPVNKEPGERAGFSVRHPGPSNPVRELAVHVAHLVAFEAYDRAIGLELSEVAVDCCITKSPCGGEKAERSPVDRGKRGIKRSVAVDAKGIPLGVVSAPANRHDSPLLGETLDAERLGFELRLALDRAR